jgi:hypothetical protein
MAISWKSTVETDRNSLKLYQAFLKLYQAFLKLKPHINKVQIITIQFTEVLK